MTTARDTAPEWFRNWWHMDVGLGRTASESYASMLSALLSAPESVRLELAALLNPWRPIETAPKDGEPVIVIPRAQYEALMGAAKEWLAEHPVREGCNCEQCCKRRPIHDALRAASIQIEGK